jgi:hypothetical protein
MRKRSSWQAWLDAHDVSAARVVASRMFERLGSVPLAEAIDPYPKGGFSVRWELEHDGCTWEALVVDVIGLGQRVATGWMLLGSVDEELNGVASRTGGARFRISGVNMLSWEIARVR